MIPHIAFQSPEQFWLLLGLIPAMWFLYRLYRAQLKARSTWGEEHVIGRHTKPLAVASVIRNGLCWLGIFILIVVGLARPVIPDAPDQVRAGTLDIVNVYDVSDSFRIEDYRGLMPGSEPGSTVATGASGSRLQMARYLTEQVMRSTSGNYMGLVIYNGAAYRLAPGKLTNDYAGLRFSMDVSLKHYAKGEGSNVAAGLSEALLMLKEAGNDGRQKVIILYTDGGYSGKPEDLQNVLVAIKQLGVRVIIIGLGGTEEKPVPMYNPQTGVYENNLELGECPKDGPADCNRTSIIMENINGMRDALGAEVDWVPPGKTALNIEWASTYGGLMETPRGKPIFDWCIYGILLLVFVISYPGIRRKSDVEA